MPPLLLAVMVLLLVLLSGAFCCKLLSWYLHLVSMDFWSLDFMDFMELPTWTFIDFMNLLDLMDFSGFQASIFGGQDPFHGSDFLPTSRRLQAKPLSMSGTLPNSNAVSFVPLLRLLQHASLWAISVPKICWMVFSL